MLGGACAGVPGRLLIQSVMTCTALVSTRLRPSGGIWMPGSVVFMRGGISERQRSFGTIMAKPFSSSPPLIRFWLASGVE